MRKPYFSIIIPTLNEEKFLPVLLTDLAEQSWADFEVIHVDGGSDDRTNTIAKRFAKQLKLKQVMTDKKNVSHQRNLGAEVANGEWIIFMDADVGLSPDFLLFLRYRIAKNGKKKKPFDVFSCQIQLNADDKKKLKHLLAKQTVNLRLASTAGGDKPKLFGAMIGVRSQLFGAVRFDEKMKFAEDIRFVSDLIEMNSEYELLSTPKYQYSMRRWDDTNILTNTAKTAKLELQMMFGDDYADVKYDMNGGTRY
ncbi:hypothetical protein FACS189431_1120 [Alphaproteobacteria bacterium]|nr:hypothetical protein FACS189431_1120 [Alphaproteobacteria bacterium]